MRPVFSLLVNFQNKPVMVANLGAHWDLSVDNRTVQLALVVEVKQKTGASPQWAARLRRNMLAHGIFPKAPYFLMVSPDQFYLWTDSDAQLDKSEPTYTIDVHPILQPYLKRVGVTAEKSANKALNSALNPGSERLFTPRTPTKTLMYPNIKLVLMCDQLGIAKILHMGLMLEEMATWQS
jgi:hypothetical protein